MKASRKAVLGLVIWGLLLGTAAPAGAKPEVASVQGVVRVADVEGSRKTTVYIATEYGEYRVAGKRGQKLARHAGKTVSARGPISTSKAGKKVIRVRRFRLVEADSAEAPEPPGGQ